ncbi:malonate decarboxylase subunit alpha [Streptomyces sp. NPDC058459]|uniref:malonate decarboxylase subunit alpha n=1 Tax=Streptomyces sp. NPDC058459 TaxID=3346508 RepID=UPI0036560D6C
MCAPRGGAGHGPVADGTVSIGAIHTYVELYARMVIGLRPDVALLCASGADENGNLYTGPNTEDTPTIGDSPTHLARGRRPCGSPTSTRPTRT